MYFVFSSFSFFPPFAHSFYRIVSQQSQIIQNEQSQPACVCVCVRELTKEKERNKLWRVFSSFEYSHETFGSSRLSTLSVVFCVCLCSCCFVYFAKEKLLKTSKFCISSSFFFSFTRTRCRFFFMLLSSYVLFSVHIVFWCHSSSYRRRCFAFLFCFISLHLTKLGLKSWRMHHFNLIIFFTVAVAANCLYSHLHFVRLLPPMHFAFLLFLLLRFCWFW